MSKVRPTRSRCKIPFMVFLNFYFCVGISIEAAAVGKRRSMSFLIFSPPFCPIWKRTPQGTHSLDESRSRCLCSYRITIIPQLVFWHLPINVLRSKCLVMHTCIHTYIHTCIHLSIRTAVETFHHAGRSNEPGRFCLGGFFFS